MDIMPAFKWCFGRGSGLARARVWALASFWAWSVPAQVGGADSIVLGDHPGGGTVQLDGATQKAELSTPDGRFPLWDGIHRLQDGSVVRVQSGIVIKDDHVQQHLGTPPYSPEVARDLCRELEAKVCGQAGACLSHEPCQAVRQLLQMIEEDIRRGPVDAPGPSLERQCQEALGRETFFQPCPTEPAAAR